MFTELPVSSPERRRTNTRWTFLISFAAEAIVVAAIVLVPLINIQALPKLWLTTSIVVWSPEPPPAPIQPTVVPGTVQKPVIPPLNVPRVPLAGGPSLRTAPFAMPRRGEAVPGVVVLGPPAPPRIKLGGNVEAAKLIYFVPAVYPAFARAAGIQGRVVFEAIISVDGTVEHLQYVSGPPLFVRAATDAVRQWRYQPTLSYGVPAEVETTITFDFTFTGSGA